MAISKDGFKAIKLQVFEYSFDGDVGYVKPITFEQQMEIANKYKGRLEDEADVEDMVALLAYTLCDEHGTLLFDDSKEALEVFREMPAKMVTELFTTIQKKIGIDTDEEIKNLKAVR